MADYHFVYKDVEGASTQWDDIQRKLGNLPPKPPAFKPPAFEPAVDPDSVPKDKSWVDEKTEEELEELEDDPDLDDDRFLEEYRFSFVLFFCYWIPFFRLFFDSGVSFFFPLIFFSWDLICLNNFTLLIELDAFFFL